MKKIALSRGKFALVDDEYFDLVSKYKWCCYEDCNTFYASRGVWNKSTKRTSSISMHRFIMNPVNNVQVDHINGDGLDNRKSNLRIVTRSQNIQNSRKRKDNKAGYKGVYWLKPNNRWRALITVNGKRVSLGLFDDRESAGKAYEVASKKYYGEYARV